jgi:hypothetical protein
MKNLKIVYPQIGADYHFAFAAPKEAAKQQEYESVKICVICG